MSGWKEVTRGRIKIEHWSTSSSVRLLVEQEPDPTFAASMEETPKTDEVWLSYEQFEHLKEALNSVDFPS